jgi:hypothetical protein
VSGSVIGVEQIAVRQKCSMRQVNMTISLAFLAPDLVRDWRLKIGLRDRKGHRRPKEWNDTGENPHRNGLSRVGAGICGFVGLDGGVRSLIRTGLSPDKWHFAGNLR